MVEIIANLEVDLLFDCAVGFVVPAEDFLKQIPLLVMTDLAIRFGDEAVSIRLFKFHDIVMVLLLATFLIRWRWLRWKVNALCLG